MTRPFSSGSQYDDWTSSNCDRCTKGYHLQPDGEWPNCKIEGALLKAYFGSGEIDDEIAELMGYNSVEQPAYGWKCNEYDATPDYIAQWKREHNED